MFKFKSRIFSTVLALSTVVLLAACGGGGGGGDDSPTASIYWTVGNYTFTNNGKNEISSYTEALDTSAPGTIDKPVIVAVGIAGDDQTSNAQPVTNMQITFWYYGPGIYTVIPDDNSVQARVGGTMHIVTGAPTDGYHTLYQALSGQVRVTRDKDRFHFSSIGGLPTKKALNNVIAQNVADPNAPSTMTLTIYDKIHQN
jgi:hypothetical protein